MIGATDYKSKLIKFVDRLKKINVFSRIGGGFQGGSEKEMSIVEGNDFR